MIKHLNPDYSIILANDLKTELQYIEVNFKPFPEKVDFHFLLTTKYFMYVPYELHTRISGITREKFDDSNSKVVVLSREECQFYLNCPFEYLIDLANRFLTLIKDNYSLNILNRFKNTSNLHNVNIELQFKDQFRYIHKLLITPNLSEYDIQRFSNYIDINGLVFHQAIPKEELKKCFMII